MIFLTGHRGLVGSSLVKSFKKNKIKFKTIDKKFLDLENKVQVNNYIKKNKFKIIILCAAKVGGILANNTYPYDFIYKNLQIQNNVISSAVDNNIKKIIFLGSSCIYPKYSKQPMKEDYLMTGDIEFTNRSYAIAKIAGLEMCWASNRQFNTKFLGLMPCNLYGEEDNWKNNNSHVIPAIIKKINEAIKNKKKTVKIWGTGNAKREFMHVDDLSEAIIKVINSDMKISKSSIPIFNVGSSKEISIRKLSILIKKIMNFKGEIKFDKTKPDGNPRKLLNSEKFQKKFNWKSNISLEEGLRKVINYYLSS